MFQRLAIKALQQWAQKEERKPFLTSSLKFEWFYNWFIIRKL